MTQLTALLAKNWILYKRSWLISLLQLFIPILLSLFVIVIRNDVEVTHYSQTQYADTNLSYLVAGPDIVNTSFLKSCTNNTVDGVQANNGKVGLAPPGDPLIGLLKTQLETMGYETKMFGSDQEIDGFVRYEQYGKDSEHPSLCFAVTVDSSQNGDYRYNLRWNITNVDETTEGPSPKFPATFIFKFYPWALLSPIKSGMLTIHNLMLNYIFRREVSQVVEEFEESSIIEMVEEGAKEYLNMTNSFTIPKEFRDAKNNPLSLNPIVSPMIQEDYQTDMVEFYLGGPIDLLTMLPLLILYLRQTALMLEEKEKRIKQTMKMMGMTSFNYYFSWFIHYFILYLIINIAHTIILSNTFRQVDISLIFVNFLLFDLVLIFQSFLVQTLCTRAKIGIMFGLLFYAVQFLISFYYKSNTEKTYEMAFIVSLSPHGACILGLKEMVYAQSVEKSLDWGNLGDVVNYTTLNMVFGSLIINLLVWAVLFLYLEQVFPNQWGAKKHPLFFLGFKKKKIINEQLMNDTQESEPEFNKKRFSQLSDPSVKLHAVTKMFEQGNKVVDELTFTMRKDQIFVLLGHNGAGKTTTISMLTGLLQPTSGSISAFGYDVVNQIKDVRKIMGVCPQINTLYDLMTVEQHLFMVGVFKGCPKDQLEVEVRKLIADVNLADKRNCYSKDLSGGQKRRLSVAMAFIGGSKLIFLDEPTSGMDTSARRYIWKMMKDYKTQKVIILTTHFMDQADFLGDQIGIMADGKMVCAGSPIDLKNKYGIGYNLTIVKQSISVDFSTINDLIRKHIPTARMTSNISLELSFQLPIQNISNFPDLLSEIDQKRQELGIQTYGLSITTLQEVFLKVAEQSHKTLQARHAIQSESQISSKSNVSDQLIAVQSSSVKSNLIQRENGGSNFWRHSKATIIKRFRVAKRDKKTMSFEFYIPIFLILLSIVILKIKFVRDIPQQTFSWDIFEQEELPLKFPISGNVSGLIIDGLAGVINKDYKNKLTALSSTSQNARSFDKNTLLPIKTQKIKGGIFVIPPIGTGLVYYALVNTRSVTSPFLLLTTATQAIINSLAPNSIRITPTNKPFPLTYTQLQQSVPVSGYLGAIAFTMALILKFSSVMAFIVKQKTDNCRHQQLVSGMNIRAYWFSNMVYDFAMYIVVAVFAAVMCEIFNVKSLIEGDARVATWLVFGLFGVAGIPYTYVGSFVFRDYGIAQAMFYFFNFLVGAIFPVLIMIFRIIGGGSADMALNFCWFLRIFPPFCFGETLINLASKKDLESIRFPGQTLEVMSNLIALPSIIYLSILPFIYIFALFLIQRIHQSQSIMRYLSHQSQIQSVEVNEDEDVGLEKQKAENGDPSDYAILTKKIRKVYMIESGEPKVAVDRLSFTVSKGEVFGLLGVNGAGKTTLFKMLAGEVTSTSGEAYFNGLEISKNMAIIRKSFGYCPQFDALLQNLTVQQQLQLYFDMKSLPVHLKSQTVDQKIQQLNLTSYRKHLSGKLSGGNKRKLSVACAMIGDPSILFLDQPSTGMDPAARRFMWKVISSIATENKQSTIILTTHSMEEAEALSTRLVIMVRGRFRCIGTPQYIKSKFGEGHELELKLCAVTEEDISKRAIFEEGHYSLSTYVDNQNLRDILISLKADHLVRNALAQNGSGRYILNHLKQFNYVDMPSLMEYIIVEQRGNAVKDYLDRNLSEGQGGCQILEHFQTFYRFKISSKIHTAKIFSVLEDCKKKLHIQQYCIKQASVEQIFNVFAMEGQNYEEN